jgi:hypothetical protein
VAYEVVARLGRGGMSVVDLARTGDGACVALKRVTFQGSAAEMARARQRLLREADVLRRLRHPNVVRLVDIIDEGDEMVLVMPYLAGGSLAERVSQHGPMPPDEVERQAPRLLGALASAHRAGIVHRDIKPGNVLFDARGEPCLADFGVAQTGDQTQGLTVTGMVVGTPGFMAPEQARGEPTTSASDVFSLGATLLFAATGRAPYGTADPGLLMVRAAAGKVERLPRSLPASLRRLLAAMLDPRPDRRPTAAALAAGPEGTLVRPRAAGARRASRAAAWVLAGGCAAALVAAGVVVVDATWGPSSSPDAAGGCTDLPYQPCGQAQPAPFTDGTACIDDHADYDGDAANGCEAAPDAMDGQPLVDEIQATIVPADDVDQYPLEVRDNFQLLCDGTLVVTIEAPEGMVLSLEVRRGDEVLGEATSANRVPGVVTLREERCIANDDSTLLAVVAPLGSERVADPYVLWRRGSF